MSMENFNICSHKRDYTNGMVDEIVNTPYLFNLVQYRNRKRFKIF